MLQCRYPSLNRPPLGAGEEGIDIVLTTTLFSWLMLKSFFHLPNAYSLEFERDPSRYAAPVDYHKRMSIDAPVSALPGKPTVTLRFDGEDRALGSGAAALRLRLQWNF